MKEVLPAPSKRPGLGCGWIVAGYWLLSGFVNVLRGKDADAIYGTAIGLLVFTPAVLIIRRLTRRWWEPIWQRNSHNKLSLSILWVVFGLAWSALAVIVSIIVGGIIIFVFVPV